MRVGKGFFGDDVAITPEVSDSGGDKECCRLCGSPIAFHSWLHLLYQIIHLACTSLHVIRPHTVKLNLYPFLPPFRNRFARMHAQSAFSSAVRLHRFFVSMLCLNTFCDLTMEACLPDMIMCLHLRKRQVIMKLSLVVLSAQLETVAHPLVETNR